MLRNLLGVSMVIAMMCVVGGCNTEDEDDGMDRPKYSPEVEKMRECIGANGKLSGALDTYLFAVGSYPSTNQGLQALISRPQGMADPSLWAGPYVDNEDCFTDFWGNKYKYVFPGKTFDRKYDIISFGPDGQEGTDDDVLNWNVR